MPGTTEKEAESKSFKVWNRNKPTA